MMRVLAGGLALGILLLPIVGLRSSLASSAGRQSIGAIAALPAGAACTPGMIAYWKLDELDGTNGYADYYDGHDGECGLACPSSRPGKVGESQRFNALSREINVPAHADFDWGPTDDFALEVWTRRPRAEELPGNQVIVGRDYSSESSARHWWLGYTTHGSAAFYINDSGGTGFNSVSYAENISDYEWHHIVVVREGSALEPMLRLYVDGELRDEVLASFGTGFDSDKEINIGWIDYGDEGFHLEGWVDELAIYSRALTGQEILAHYDAGWDGRGYCSTPTIDVAKSVDASVVHAGTHVNYSYLVSNPGDVALAAVNVGDDKCAPLSGPTGDDGNGLLDPDGVETWTYTCGMALDVDTTNTVTATAAFTYPIQSTVSGSDSVMVNVISPDVEVDKRPDRDTIYAGETVTYTYVVSNTGNDGLGGVTLADDLCAPVVQVDGNDDALDPGESWTFQCSMAPTRDITNTATFRGTDELGSMWTFTGTAFVDVIAPDVEFVKTAEPEVIYAGHGVTYTYSVSNHGDDRLYDVAIRDDKCVPVNLVGSNDGHLDPGEDLSYICTTTINNDTTNVGTFIGADTLGRPWTFTDTATVRVLGPQIAIAKGADDTTIVAGVTARYSYTVTNPGNVPLSNVLVRDDKCAPVNFFGGDQNGNNKLDPGTGVGPYDGETWIYRCSMALDVSTTNRATVSGVDPLGRTVTSDPAYVTVYVRASEHMVFLPLAHK
jgi:uncharacterized repeat protein (TIGR01451 family)